MMRCDLCGKTAKCVQKEIEGKEFDVCEPCWTPFAEKLRGKGRGKDPVGESDHAGPGKSSLEEMEEYEELVY
jgi:ribosome-binding protein aMBF1 (putative translation factor)